jgi:voltage-gated potassium channel
MISKLRYIVWLTWKRIIHRPALSILLAVAVIFIIACSIIGAYEDIGFGKAVLKVFPAFLGELGEIEGPNLQVQISLVVGLLASITFIVIITAKITSLLIEFLMRGGSMAKKVNFTGHTIICGWNFQGERIVKELLTASANKQRGIVILADSEKRPIDDERVEFIKGDPSQDEDLIRAGIHKADSIIVLTDFTRDANVADAQALMIALAVESLNQEVHTCVQIMNSANLLHLKHAHANEIICLDQMGGSLAVASALHHGVSEVISELLTFNIGSEIYRYDNPLSDELVGKEFATVLQNLAEKRMILLAVETEYSAELKELEKADALHKLQEKDRVVIINPQSNYTIRQGDALFIAAESEPSGL